MYVCVLCICFSPSIFYHPAKGSSIPPARCPGVPTFDLSHSTTWFMYAIRTRSRDKIAGSMDGVPYIHDCTYCGVRLEEENTLKETGGGVGKCHRGLEKELEEGWT